jgi:hypothetical protein
MIQRRFDPFPGPFSAVLACGDAQALRVLVAAIHHVPEKSKVSP